MRHEHVRKHILILGHSYKTQFLGIANQYVQLFNKDQYEVTVAYLIGAPDDNVRQETLAEHVVFLDLPKSYLRGLKVRAVRQILSLVRTQPFQLVICHRYKSSYLMMIANLIHRVPQMIFIMHALHTMAARGRQFVIAALARKNCVFAGVSDAVRDDMRHDLWSIPKDRFITLYNTLDIEKKAAALLSREDARHALHLPQDKFIFGNIARLIPGKDQASLIQAFAHFKASYPAALLVLIGDGESLITLQQQAKALGLEKDIIFTGYLSEASRYMAAFDCFAFTSLQEAFGLVILEAMIAKLPIITTNVDGIPEVIGDTGILIPKKDVAALTNAMKEIYQKTSEQRTAMGTRARLHADRFSFNQFNEYFWQLPAIQYLKHNY